MVTQHSFFFFWLKRKVPAFRGEPTPQTLWIFQNTTGGSELSTMMMMMILRRLRTHMDVWCSRLQLCLWLPAKQLSVVQGPLVLWALHGSLLLHTVARFHRGRSAVNRRHCFSVSFSLHTDRMYVFLLLSFLRRRMMCIDFFFYYYFIIETGGQNPQKRCSWSRPVNGCSSVLCIQVSYGTEHCEKNSKSSLLFSQLTKIKRVKLPILAIFVVLPSDSLCFITGFLLPYGQCFIFCHCWCWPVEPFSKGGRKKIIRGINGRDPVLPPLCLTPEVQTLSIPLDGTASWCLSALMLPFCSSADKGCD